jgi:hypothetical protein
VHSAEGVCGANPCAAAYAGGVGKFLLVVLVFAALVYTVFWLLERRRAGRPSAGRAPNRPATRTLGPDDDEEFLRDLNRRYRPRDPGPSE